jgi:hypothetical protein
MRRQTSHRLLLAHYLSTLRGKGHSWRRNDWIVEKPDQGKSGIRQQGISHLRLRWSHEVVGAEEILTATKAQKWVFEASINQVSVR